MLNYNIEPTSKHRKKFYHFIFNQDNTKICITNTIPIRYKFLKLSLFLFISVLLFAECSAQKQSATKSKQIVELARTQLGTPYHYGGKSPATGFDCSGLVYYVFNQNGINVPRSSYNYKNWGEKIPIAEAKTGDIILFTGWKDSLRIGHVGIISKVNTNKIWFIHSSSGKKHTKVIETNLQKSAYMKRFVGIRRN